MRALPLLLAACVPPGFADRSAFDPHLPPPAIADLTVSCDAEDGRWRVDVETDAWAGGAVLVWTIDGLTAERHDGFRSVRAAVDGTEDLLRADIGIVEDFRASGSGQTAFGCRETPSGIVQALALDRRPSDCVRWGERILAVPRLPECRPFATSE